MGMALYISLQKEIEGFDHVNAVDGKSLGKEFDFFESEIQKMNGRPISDFISASTEDMEMFFDDPEDMPEVEEKWFTPQEGLDVLTVYNEIAHKHKGNFGNFDWVIEDIESMRTVLTKAKQSNILWHLSCDV